MDLRTFTVEIETPAVGAGDFTPIEVPKLGRSARVLRILTRLDATQDGIAGGTPGTAILAILASAEAPTSFGLDSKALPLVSTVNGRLSLSGNWTPSDVTASYDTEIDPTQAYGVGSIEEDDETWWLYARQLNGDPADTTKLYVTITAEVYR